MSGEGSSPSPIESGGPTRSGVGWRIKLCHQPVEDRLKIMVVLLGVRSNEVDDFPVAVGCALVISSRLIDHSEAIVSVMHVGEAHQEIVCGLLGLVEFGVVDKVDDGIRRCGEFVVVVTGVCGGEFVAHFHENVGKARHRRVGGHHASGEHRALGGLVLFQAASLVFLATAARTGIIASGFAHRSQHLEQDGEIFMSAVPLTDARFHELLLAFDHDLAAAARAGRCPRCGDVLHSAKFRRKPRGRPAGLGEAYDQRFSFCCAKDECRKRKTPASFRFLGRKVYFAALVVLISAMQHGATAARVQRLSKLVGVSRRTVARWREWWLSVFATSPFWQVASAALMPPVDNDRLPASLLERFAGSTSERLIGVLRFLGPITGSIAVHAG